MRGLIASIAAAACVAALGAGLAGCRGDRTDKPPRQFLPDMDDSPKWHPQGASPFFLDAEDVSAEAGHVPGAELGRMMRPKPAGAVAFGALPVAAAEGQFDPGFRDRLTGERRNYLRDDDAFYYGVDETGAPVDTIPMEVTRALLERGAERFNIYCAVCHGYAGDGAGMVGRRWSIPVPTYHDPKYSDPAQRTGKDGYLFHVARYGLKNPDGSIRMPAYGHALDAEDAWAVVAYIRALQAAGVGEQPEPADGAGGAAGQEGAQ
jgi:mono/diheme cytochrome c family protein